MSAAERLRELADAATPGPWFTETGGVYNATRGYLVVPTGDSDQDRADAAFIAAANPAVVAQLLAWVEWVAAVKDDACRYDHHAYCQSHNLDEHPCPMEGIHAFFASEPGVST